MIVTARNRVIQITLEEAEHDVLSAVAKTRSMSVAEIVETALDEAIDSAYGYLRDISTMSPAAAGVARNAAIKILNS